MTQPHKVIIDLPNVKEIIHEMVFQNCFKNNAKKNLGNLQNKYLTNYRADFSFQIWHIRSCIYGGHKIINLL